MQFEQLGPYRIGQRLGRGGMGEVFEGVQVETGERVALKVLNPALATADGFRERFEAEIASLRKLHHPSIVRLYGFGEQEGYLFYAMELIDGRNIEDELRAGRRFTWREVTEIGIQLCKALKHAHDHGIIHRDLKPANVVLTSDGHVKLLDFGIARLFGNTQLTSAGGVLGTADYMSPEQADGRPVTDRCDQYSLGGVMYALATGRPPFQARSLPELLHLQRYADPEPVRRYAHDVPVELERIILQLLAKDPEKRFPNVLVLAKHMTAMVRAFSRPVSEDDFTVSEEDVPSSTSLTGFDSLGATRIQESKGSTAVPDKTEAPIVRERKPASGPLDKTLVTNLSQTTKVPPKPSHFIAVEDEEAPAEENSLDPWWLVPLQVAGLVLMLAAMGAGVWYLLRPASADTLYARIVAAEEGQGDQGLLSVNADLADFAERFPEDPRISEIESLRERADIAKTERMLRARARLKRDDEQLSPLAVLSIDALRQSDSAPERAAAQLKALIELYEDQELSPEDKNYLTVAKRQLAQLDARIQMYAPAQLQMLQAQLDRAHELRASEPEKASRLYSAIVELSRDRPWATKVSQEASAALQSLGTAQAAASSKATSDQSAQASLAD